MKFYVRADAYNELIEKGYGKRDLSKLTRKVITDKNGHRRTVFVRNDVEKLSKRITKKQQDAFMESGKSKVIEAMKNVLGTDNVKVSAFRSTKTDGATHFIAMVNYDEVKDHLKNDSAKNELAKELTKLGLKPDETFENVHEARWEYSERIPKTYKFNFYIKDENMKMEPKPEGDPRTGKKSYWVQDNRGNRLTNSDAKERVINNNKKIAELDKQISGMSKADAIRLNTQKHDLEYQNSYLMDRLNSEDRKEIESEKKQNEDKTSSNGSAETEKILESLKGKRFSINDIGTRTYSISKHNNGYVLTLNSDYVVQSKPIAGKITVNNDGSITLHGYATYGETVADKDSDYARKNIVLRDISVKFSADELKNQNSNFINKLIAYSTGYSSNKDFTIKRV